MRTHSPQSEAAQRRKSRRKQWTPPKLKRTPIPVSTRIPVACLQANYAVSDQGTMRIHALTPEGQLGKERFHRDAWRYANALGQALAHHGGFTEKRITKNRGSAQDAGGVMAAYYHPRLPCWLSVYIESNRARTALPRADGVIIIACRRFFRQTREGEALFHLNPALSSEQLAQVLLLLVGVKKAADFEREAIQPPPDQGLFTQNPFQPPSGGDSARTSTEGAMGTVVRVLILGKYRQCMLLRPGRTTVEVVCIDNHPGVALGYWGRSIAQPLSRVHPDDRARCALPGAERIPGQAHQDPHGHA